MEIPCPKCGSRNTEILPDIFEASDQGWPAKVASALGKTVDLQPKERIVGQRDVVCRDCGLKMVVHFD
ncbi:MAG: hypothetical protein LBT38_06525 [Deltaproteobacteria bacterium]|nr:hypothetical protein [Deltaproteobacteria bacterium]